MNSEQLNKDKAQANLAQAAKKQLPSAEEILSVDDSMLDVYGNCVGKDKLHQRTLAPA